MTQLTHSEAVAYMLMQVSTASAPLTASLSGVAGDDRIFCGVRASTIHAAAQLAAAPAVHRLSAARRSLGAQLRHCRLDAALQWQGRAVAGFAQIIQGWRGGMHVTSPQKEERQGAGALPQRAHHSREHLHT
jgi:hypothetical protein